jgi:hypothetical protein
MAAVLRNQIGGEYVVRHTVVRLAHEDNSHLAEVHDLATDAYYAESCHFADVLDQNQAL